METFQKNRRVPVGDGKRFKDSIEAMGCTMESIRLKMIMPKTKKAPSNGKFNELYYKSEWNNDEKAAAAKALGKSIEEIFGKPESEPDARKKRIPMIGEGAAGGDMEINVQDNHYISDYIDVGDLLSDSESAFTVYGNSMTPAYPSGCILGIKRNKDNFIQPGETYLLLTKSNRLFKRLYYNDANDGFTCISDNNMKHESGPMSGRYFYPSFDVHKDDVIAVFDVVGMIRRNRNSGIINRK